MSLISPQFPEASKVKLLHGNSSLPARVHDTLTAKKSLFIRSTGKALGSVQYAEIEIEKGGDLQGSLQKIDGDGNPSTSSGSF